MGVNDWAIVLYFDPWGAQREVEQRFCVKQKIYKINKLTITERW